MFILKGQLTTKVKAYLHQGGTIPIFSSVKEAKVQNVLHNLADKQTGKI